jgi:hypothetical protein
MEKSDQSPKFFQMQTILGGRRRVKADEVIFKRQDCGCAGKNVNNAKPV